MTFSVRTKLLAAFTVVIALMVAMVLVGQAKTAAVGDKAEVIATEFLGAGATLGEAEADLKSYRQHQLAYVVAADADGREDMAEELGEEREEIAGAFADAKRDFVNDPTERRLLDAAVAAWAAYERDTLRLPAGQDSAVALLDRAEETHEEVDDALDALQEHEAKLSARAQADAGDTEAAARTISYILLAAAIAAALLVAFLLSRSITSSVATILDRLSRLRDDAVAGLRTGLDALATGDLTHEVHADPPAIERTARDELGTVAVAVNDIRRHTLDMIGTYNTTRTSLASMMGEVQATTQVVSSASHEMAGSASEGGRALGEISHAIGEVAAGGERQARSLDLVRTISDEVVSATSTSAEQARRTAESASDAIRIADGGADAVAAASDAMGAVKDSTDEATAAIRGLGAKNDQIGGIVATITGIAEQTNLLALNAAIEAARAGEQGRGFAVVAEEVRKLAEESQGAAGTIASLIAEIQAETDAAVAVVERGAEQTHEGAATVEEARAQFRRIGQAIADVAARVDEIATTVAQVAGATERVHEHVTEIATIAEQTSATSEEVSASTQQTTVATAEVARSAGELARAAGGLQELVGRFRLGS